MTSASDGQAHSPGFFQKLFGTGTSEVRKKKPQQTASSTKTAAEDINFQAFKKRLKEISEQQDVVIASNLHLLNIAKVKEKIGDRWTRLSPVIQMNIEQIINKHLKKGDEVLRRSELNYAIVFQNASKDETNFRLAKISKEIVERVFGTDALTEGFQLESTASSITSQFFEKKESLKEIFAALDSSNQRQIYSRATFADAGKEVEKQSHKFISGAHSTLSDVKSDLSKVMTMPDLNEFIAILEELSPRLEETAANCRALLEQAASWGGQESSIAELEQILKTTNDYAHAITSLQEQASARQERMESATPIEKLSDQEILEKTEEAEQLVFVDPDEYTETPSSALDPLKNAQFVYLPIWDIKRELITTFKCEIQPKGGHASFSVQKLFSGHTLEDALLQMNLAVLRHTIRDMQTFAEEGVRCGFTVSVAFSSVSVVKNRTQIIQAISAIPEKQRNLLVIEIVNIDANTWASRIAEAVGFLKFHCRAVLLRLPPRYRYLFELKQAGVYAVGHDIGELNLKEANIFEELDNLCALAEQTKIKIFLTGVNTMSIASGAIAAGTDYIEGKIVPMDQPVNVRQLTLASVYASQFSVH